MSVKCPVCGEGVLANYVTAAYDDKYHLAYFCYSLLCKCCGVHISSDSRPRDKEDGERVLVETVSLVEEWRKQRASDANEEEMAKGVI